jgi:hypothetical protein
LPTEIWCGSGESEKHDFSLLYGIRIENEEKKHGQLLSVKDMFKCQQKHVNRRSNRHA